MAVTIKDVADLASVSTATVSRVLNNETGIKESTRLKVIAAITNSGYRINTIARSLKTNRSKIIGLITPEIANDFFMNIARGIEAYLKDFGYSLIICNTNESVYEEKRRAELLIEKCVDGVIIIPSTDTGEHFIILRNAGIPVVFADRLTWDFDSDAVVVDNLNGAYMAVSYLIARDKNRIAFIGGSNNLSNARERYNGYIKAFKEQSLELDEKLVFIGDFHVNSGFRIMRELMNLKKPPDQVFIANDYMHMGAIKYLIANDFNPNNSPRIGSFDDLELSSILGYSSVSVAQPVKKIGSKAAELLLNRLKGEIDTPFQTIQLETDLKISRMR
ncbi:MAG: LacI family DNA-binding transcriptional regulator [Spirochaetaceae bacterium]|nr:LacI family DNA-binding transcriptional regulator [Spirochaetaceae bacterium]